MDTHRHTWESLIRATGPDWSHAQYFTGVRTVMGGLYTPEDNYVGNLLGALEALDSGITTLYDWSHNNNSPEHADASVEGLKDSGIRGVFAYGNSNAEWFPPNTIATNYDDIRRVRKQHFPSDDGLVTMAVAARGPQFTTLDITEKDFRTARDLGVRITVHVGDGLWGFSRPLVQLQSRGLLGDDTTYVHCNTIGDERIPVDRRYRRHRLDRAGGRDADGARPAAGLALPGGGDPPEPLDRRGHHGARRHVRRHAGVPRRHPADGAPAGA